MMMRGSFLAAKDKYEEAVRTAPNTAVSYVNLASLVLRVSKNTQEAVTLLNKAVQKDPCCIQAYILLIQVYTLMNKEQEIQDVIKKGLECAVDFDDVAEVLGYKYVIEVSSKCNAYVQELKKKKTESL